VGILEGHRQHLPTLLPAATHGLTTNPAAVLLTDYSNFRRMSLRRGSFVPVIHHVYKPSEKPNGGGLFATITEMS